MPLTHFHPLTQRWFAARFAAPTEAQRLGWPGIAAGSDTLIAAPTGSGKTLAAFLFSIDRLLQTALRGELEERTRVVYVSPLRALSNDIQRNLQTPLAELLELARQEQGRCPEIRALVRTGDTPASERQKMVRHPPHILVTTPESFYLLLTGARSREILRDVDTVIVDEIHALARDRRGSHLALSLERLESQCLRRPVRIGLSATQKPIEEIARFLSGVHADRAPAQVVDAGHLRRLDLAVEMPATTLQAVCSHEQWAEIYEHLVALIQSHTSTLIFVNTRRLAERVAQQLSERLGPDTVASHHGSLALSLRQRTEERLKQGGLRAVVATASLELGIDIGHIDLVCQLGTPRSIATLLQRIGRAGHALGAVPKGRLFALTRDELIECLALIRAVKAGRLDRIVIPNAPLDILSQQIVAAVACADWDEDELFELCRRAYPYRELSRADFESIVAMLSDGVTARRGRSNAFLHRDLVARRLRARRGARITAITCGGAIPEIADYRVVLEDEKRTVIGAVHEDFAIESMSGDVFLLGNNSWKIRYVRGGEVVVEDAHGAPPTIPFWLGEAPGRTVELSAEVSQLREEISQRSGDRAEAVVWLMKAGEVAQIGAEQALDYVAVQQLAVGMIPTQQRILFERFFDESGGMQLVVHAPFGTRINRAWGLALRKRFCRTFNFELQAAANDNGIVLSLGPQHSFPLEQMFLLVDDKHAREILVQALLDTPFFTNRWRWNATRALAVRRMEMGRRVPAPLQRFRADDLLSAVFPQQTGCLENIVGDIEVPDHPLVRQTMDDCLHEATDLDGWCAILKQIEAGAVKTIGLDTREPSPFAHELLNANPYAFLDDAPLEERRARAINLRRTLSPDALRDLGRLDPEAIAQVRSEVWPLVRDADELHDALLSLLALPAAEGDAWQAWFSELRGAGRACVGSVGARLFWIAAERCPAAQAIWPELQCQPPLTAPPGVRLDWEREPALVELIRGRLEVVAPVTATALAHTFGIDPREALRSLIDLEIQGVVLRGRFTAEALRLADNDELTIEWCERRLLARIHRLTLDGLRRQIAPVPPEQFLQFLLRHQHIVGPARLRGQAGLLEVVEQLQGFETPAGDWERYLLPGRVEGYDPSWLDMTTLSGQVVWGRLRPGRRAADRARPARALTRSIPLTLMLRRDLSWLLRGDSSDGAIDSRLGSNAQGALEALRARGALFPDQIAAHLHLVPAQIDDVLGELVAAGLATCDGFAGLRKMIAQRADQRRLSRRPRYGTPTLLGGGRWCLLAGLAMGDGAVEEPARLEGWCRLLLRRYGVMFRDLLARESAAPPWYLLLRTFRTLEARGEVRGGRFVAQVAGEQFALPDTVQRLRQPDAVAAGRLVLPATDPLNLFGRVVPGPKVPASPGNRLVMQAGGLVAYRVGAEVNYVPEVPPEDHAAIEALLRRAWGRIRP